VPDLALADHLATEQSRAIRALLRFPLLDAANHPDMFRLVSRHAPWLVLYFENACGWMLNVDPAAGFARLGKRASRIDVSRPLKRTRGSAASFDRRRYQLLCLICAELVRHPITTVGLLAGAITADAALDSSRHAERAAFVDSLRALMDWGALQSSAGDVDAFLDSEHGNAILTADTSRLHRLLVGTTAPSSLPEVVRTDEATESLLAEPRYGMAAIDSNEADDEQRLRWARHTLCRRALDDPATYYDDLADVERAYLAAPAGRKWLRDRVAEAGFELEERAEGFVAIDAEGTATDWMFPAASGNAHQLALLLIDRLISVDAIGHRTLTALGPSDLRRMVDGVLDRFPGWARAHREGDGPDQLGSAAVDLLVGFGLARRDDDGTVRALPAIARYRIGEPTTNTKARSLFEDD
jgi:uncharacterized protein (TIGR02678 family)